MSRARLAALALLPLVLFALGLLLYVEPRLDEGDVLGGIGGLVLMLAALGTAEGLLFRKVLLPLWGEKLGEKLYAGTYSPDADALVQLVEQVRRTGDRELLGQLRQMVLRQPDRLRGWTELASLQRYEFADAAAACATMQEAAAAVRDPQDVAMLLYRAAALARTALNDAPLAERLLQQAATQHPATVYGAKAAAELR